MNNEELLRQIDELRDNYYNYSPNEVIRRLEELSKYVNNNRVVEEKIEDLKEDKDVVYGDIQANPDEPKDIVLSSFGEAAKKATYNDTDNLRRDLVDSIIKQNEEDEYGEGYIPGTNIRKPRDRKVFKTSDGYKSETDEEYEKFLKEFYSKHFPKAEAQTISIGKDVDKESLVNNEEKGLALVDDVKKPESIENLSKAIETLSNSKDGASDEKDDDFDKKFEDSFTEDGLERGGEDYFADFHQDDNVESKEKASDTKSSDDDVINFDSDEERDAFENEQEMDYKKDKGKKTKKVGKIRKALRKFKEVIKKHKKKIIAGILVAAAGIGVAMSVKACSYDKKENNTKDSKSNIEEYDADIPSVTAADSFTNDSNDVSSDDIVEAIETDGFSTNQDYKPIDENASFNIGDTKRFTGDELFYTAKDAANDINGLKPDIPKNVDGTISLIHFLSPDGKETKTAYTKEEATALRNAGWKEQALNFKYGNIPYVGWVTEKSFESAKGK